MAAKIPAVGDVGKTTKDLLYGGKSGVFQFNKLVTIDTKTADGVAFAVQAVNKDDSVETSIKATFKSKQFGLSAGFNAIGRLSGTLNFFDVAPGLTASLIGTLPDVTTAKLGLDYVAPYTNLKATIGLSAVPKVDVAVSTGFGDVVMGGIASYDSAKSTVTAWSLIAGWTRADYQGAIALVDKGETMKVSYTHNIDSRTQAGAEVTKKLSSEDKTAFLVGYGKILENGALSKVRLSNDGIASLLYEQDLAPGSRIALSSQFDATDLSKAPKFGIALGLKN